MGDNSVELFHRRIQVMVDEDLTLCRAAPEQRGQFLGPAESVHVQYEQGVAGAQRFRCGRGILFRIYQALPFREEGKGFWEGVGVDCRHRLPFGKKIAAHSHGTAYRVAVGMRMHHHCRVAAGCYGFHKGLNLF